MRDQDHKKGISALSFGDVLSLYRPCYPYPIEYKLSSLPKNIWSEDGPRHDEMMEKSPRFAEIALNVFTKRPKRDSQSRVVSFQLCI